MVEKAGKEECKLEATGIGVVEGSSVVMLVARATEPVNAMHVQKGIPKLEKDGPTFPMY